MEPAQKGTGSEKELSLLSFDSLCESYGDNVHPWLIQTIIKVIKCYWKSEPHLVDNVEDDDTF